MKDKVVVAVAGMPGSGKAAFRKNITKLGFPVVVMGDIVREEARIRKLEPTPENLGTLMLKLRAADGPAAVAKRCIPKLKKATDRIVGVDGIRQVSDAVLRINLFYEEGDAGQFPPTVRDIEMVNVTSRKSKYALYLRGYKHNPLRNIRISNCSFENAALPDVIENVEGLVFD